MKAKAKRLNNGEWVEGYHVHQYGCDSIYLPDGVDSEYGSDNYHIDVKTLSFCTEKTDVDNNLIWTNDIVQPVNNIHIGVVEYSTEDACFILKTSDNLSYMLSYFESLKKLGNVFDNPELLSR